MNLDNNFSLNEEELEKKKRGEKFYMLFLEDDLIAHSKYMYSIFEYIIFNRFPESILNKLILKQYQYGKETIISIKENYEIKRRSFKSEEEIKDFQSIRDFSYFKPELRFYYMNIKISELLETLTYEKTKDIYDKSISFDSCLRTEEEFSEFLNFYNNKRPEHNNYMFREIACNPFIPEWLKKEIEENTETDYHSIHVKECLKYNYNKENIDKELRKDMIYKAFFKLCDYK